MYIITSILILISLVYEVIDPKETKKNVGVRLLLDVCVFLSTFLCMVVSVLSQNIFASVAIILVNFVYTVKLIGDTAAVGQLIDMFEEEQGDD